MKITKFIKKCLAGMAVGMVAVLGFTPLPVFAQSNEEMTVFEEEWSEEFTDEEYKEEYKEKEAEKETTEKNEITEESAEETCDPLTPDGNMNLVDDFGSIEAGGKQFITVTTKSGNYFYIIIDRDDNGAETVHFLNLVDESDLLALMEDEEVESYMSSKGMSGKEEQTVESETVEEETTEMQTQENSEPADKKSPNVTGIMALLLLTVTGGIGGFIYLKSGKQNKKQDEPDPDMDYIEDEEENYLDNLEEEREEDKQEDSKQDNVEDDIQIDESDEE